jgi:hypothetical protein
VQVELPKLAAVLKCTYIGTFLFQVPGAIQYDVSQVEIVTRMEIVWTTTLATERTFATSNMIWKNRMSLYRYVFHQVLN